MAYEINGLSLVVLKDPDAENAIGQLTTAERFLEAAEKLVTQDENPPVVGDPESYLTGHALELLLKSFLLALGISAQELRNKFSHDLRKCLQVAEAKDLGKIAPVSPLLRQAANLLSNEYSRKQLEYSKGSYGSTRPGLAQFLAEIRNVYEALKAVYEEASKADRAQRSRPWR